MHSLYVMEWNSKAALQWDWESLLMLNAKALEIPKKLQTTDWGHVGEGGIENGSVYSSGGGGCSGSELGHGASSKSSISASIDSSKEGLKASGLSLKTFEDFPRDFCKKKDLTRVEATRTSPALGDSVGSGEPPIGLKLGKRTYFEDIGAGSTTKTSSFSVIPTSSTNTAKRSRATCQNMQSPHCQVEGCNVDLTSAKDYHRKHRVCESHSKCEKVIVAGLELRFCQQCSRFHGLLEFDGKKRSCRKRLSDHNARRRKPHPQPIQFNSERLSSSLYDQRQHMSLVLNRAQHVHARPPINPTWETTYGFKPTLAKGYFLKPAKGGDVNKQLHMHGNELPSAISALRHDSNMLLPSKGTTAEILTQGLVASTINAHSDATRDSRRALSLLSTTSWGFGKPEPASMNQFMHVSHGGVAQPVMHAMPQGSLFASSESWQAEQQSTESRVQAFASNGNGNSQFEEFQLFKEQPYESGIFYSNQMNMN